MTASVIRFATCLPVPLVPFTTIKTRGCTQEAVYSYSSTQQTRRLNNPSWSSKRVLPFVGPAGTPPKGWDSEAGDAPWPMFWSSPPDPSQRDCWVVEAEGEKTALYAAAAGFIAVSQPGHDFEDHHIRHRYRQLKEQVGGVVYVADADNKGLSKAFRLQQAAEIAGLKFIAVRMGDLFPGLPEGGSLDDLADVPGAIAKIVEFAEGELQWLPGAQLELPAADPEPAQAALRSDVASRDQFTFERLLPPDLAEAAAYLSGPLTADPLIVSLVFLVALSGALPIGTAVASSALYQVPINEFLALIAGTGSAKSSLYAEFLERPFADVVAHEKQLHLDAVAYWRQLDSKERGDRPAPMHALLSDWNNAAALDLELERHAARQRGILLCADELEGILAAVATDAANGSGRGEAQLLQLFDGGGNSSTRVSRDGGDYSASHVSVIGGIQPEILAKAIKGTDYSGKWARFLFLQLPAGVIRPPDHDPSQEELRRRDEYRKRLRDAVTSRYRMQPRTYRLSQEGRAKFNAWFVRHQERALLESTAQVVAAMLRKSSAHALRIAGIHHVAWRPEQEVIELESIELAMQVVDQLFQEAEVFHKGDGDLIDLLMDRMRATGGDVTWGLMWNKRLNQHLKAKARSRHFKVAVSNLVANGEGSIVKPNPLTWRR